MIWWFLILGISTLVVVCVAIALYIRLRRHLQAAHAAQEGISNDTVAERQSRDIEQ
jgi:membrane protein required for beta-lactamase induction